MGPPGTGKTYRLVNHYLKKELNDYAIDPEKIVYITFSRAAEKKRQKELQNYFLIVN